jgi:hypothetical protein
MRSMGGLRFPGLLSGVLVLAGCATVPPVPRGDISVSGANYVTSSYKELRRIANRPVDEEGPIDSDPPPATEPQGYIFYPGEIYASDLSWEELRPRLEAALAVRGYINRENAQGVIDLANTSLVLRISYGERIWREPVVRITDLQWREGILAENRLARAVGAGGEVIWDFRAGGDDRTLRDVMHTIAMQAATAAAENNETPPMPITGSDLIDGRASRPHFLIVVDAFDLRELVQLRDKAQRRWTTFIALPTQEGDQFSRFAGAMLKRAAPYFGQTTTGKVLFPHGRVEIEAGGAVDAPAPAPAVSTPPTEK